MSPYNIYYIICIHIYKQLNAHKINIIISKVRPPFTLAKLPYDLVYSALWRWQLWLEWVEEVRVTYNWWT